MRLQKIDEDIGAVRWGRSRKAARFGVGLLAIKISSTRLAEKVRQRTSVCCPQLV